MNWELVVQYLEQESESLKMRANAFGDLKTRDEMWGRARMATLLAGALKAGLVPGRAGE